MTHASQIQITIACVAHADISLHLASFLECLLQLRNAQWDSRVILPLSGNFTASNRDRVLRFLSSNMRSEDNTATGPDNDFVHIITSVFENTNNGAGQPFNQHTVQQMPNSRIGEVDFHSPKDLLLCLIRLPELCHSITPC